MATVDVLIEVSERVDSAFSRHRAAIESASESNNQAENLVSSLSSLGVDVVGDFAPVPLFTDSMDDDRARSFSEFSATSENADVSATSVVVAAKVERSELSSLANRSDLKVWPNSPIVLYNDEESLIDLARSSGGIDCRPFRPGVSISALRELLSIESVWTDGFRGQNIIVGIIDEGVNGDEYPVIGGYSSPNTPPPGSAAITSHGSMCAADVMVAAPAARLYDYPFLGNQNSGGALQMFQSVLDQRRIDGTPHITNNSYGFVGKPPLVDFPNHEVWDINHPLHRKVREVIASGAPAFFAAGNCGSNCPSGNCHISGIGPGHSIHASNSLEEVITVAAVNSRHERIGYSSQGPGGFEANKPDVAAYSHFFANFGEGRPGGLAQLFDNGTSAATPVAAGVGALLMSAFEGRLTPELLKQVLMDGAINLGSSPGWDTETGHGVINAASAYSLLKDRLPSVVPA